MASAEQVIQDSPPVGFLERIRTNCFRGLRRDHVFKAVSLLILALGIGANVVVFRVVNL